MESLEKESIYTVYARLNVAWVWKRVAELWGSYFANLTKPSTRLGEDGSRLETRRVAAAKPPETQIYPKGVHSLPWIQWQSEWGSEVGDGLGNSRALEGIFRCP